MVETSNLLDNFRDQDKGVNPDDVIDVVEPKLISDMF